MRIRDRSPVPQARPPAQARPASAEPSQPSLLARVIDRFEDALRPLRTYLNPRLPVPEDRGGLRMASFNVERGKQGVPAIAAEIARHSPDVVCLQELDERTARALGDSLGMHVAFYELDRGRLRVNGKAILSRYPIEGADNLLFRNDWARKRQVAFSGEKRKPEAMESRSALCASLRVGNRVVDVIDTHLSLADAQANASQIKELAGLAEARRKLGHTVLMAGDFNANFALATPGAADPRGLVSTPTDTLDEFADRYGVGAGNIADPAVRAAAADLLSGMQHHWQARERAVLVGVERLTPEGARAELASGKVEKGSPRWKTLVQALDGVTHLGARKRFDNILASRDVRIESAWVDQGARASDHQPVVAEIRWD